MVDRLLICNKPSLLYTYQDLRTKKHQDKGRTIIFLEGGVKIFSRQTIFFCVVVVCANNFSGCNFLQTIFCLFVIIIIIIIIIIMNIIIIIITFICIRLKFIR